MMKISLYVHDLHLEIGHSRALIELLNGLNPEQKDQITLIEVVAFSSTHLEKLFPDFKAQKNFVKVPFKKLSPFLLKMMFYHFYTFFYSMIYARQKIKIGIGIASLNVDIANIQFVHEQWNHLFFKQRKLNPVSYLYKKLLFLYFQIAEIFFFRSQKRQYITIAQFISDFLNKRFQVNSKQITLIPSAVNPFEFQYSDKGIIQTWDELAHDYPQLQKLDINKPIALFVGAYERKGLDLALDFMASQPNSQFIIVGKAEDKNRWKIPTHINVAQVEFTKNVRAFYEVSDLFIFPTYYEPFGLVIIEAFAMGLDIIVPKDNVGASEILPNTDGLFYFRQGQHLPSVKMQKLSKEIKNQRRSERLSKMSAITWENGAQSLFEILKLNI